MARAMGVCRAWKPENHTVYTVPGPGPSPPPPVTRTCSPPCYVLFCSVLFGSVPFCSVLLCSVLFCSILLCHGLPYQPQPNQHKLAPQHHNAQLPHNVWGGFTEQLLAPLPQGQRWAQRAPQCERKPPVPRHAAGAFHAQSAPRWKG
eukprot:gene9164-biopygen6190